MCVMMATYMFLKLIVQYCPCIVFITDQALKDAVYVLFREAFLATIGITILECVNYYSGLTYLNVNPLGSSYSALLCICTFVIVGLYLVLKA